MVYSDIIKNNWHTILSKKKKYTMKDINTILKSNLFNEHNDIKNYSSLYKKNIARFIVLCTAIYYDVKYSKKLTIPINTLPIYNGFR